MSFSSSVVEQPGPLGVLVATRVAPGTCRDTTLAGASDLARSALLSEVPAAQVGEHLGCADEGERLACHLFACARPGYRGWLWSVTVSRLPRARTATVLEVTLLPGPDALLAPGWVPWSERVVAGDLRPGDVLPTATDDPRVVPAFTAAADGGPLDDADPLTPAGWEMGLGRMRVLSAIGRDAAATRWQEGEAGPRSPLARAATLSCSTCAYFVHLSGPLGQQFGACANEVANDDGRVVSADHGCGAHSEGVIVQVAIPLAPVVIDDDDYDVNVPDVPEGASELEGTDVPEGAAQLEGADVPEGGAPLDPAADRRGG